MEMTNELKKAVEKLNPEHVLTYGLSENCDVVLTHFEQKDTEAQFQVNYQGKLLGKFTLRVPGAHNALNALGVIGLGIRLGLSTEQIQQGLRAFAGTKRRSEIIGKTDQGAVIIDDYAHHPKEISTTLSSLKNAYHSKKIVCIFQPHTYSRTESLLNEFAQNLSAVDELILLPVFASAREEEVEDKVSSRLVEAIQDSGKNVHFLQTASDVIKFVTQNYNSSEFVILTMGAGDVYKISEKLKVRSSK